MTDDNTIIKANTDSAPDAWLWHSNAGYKDAYQQAHGHVLFPPANPYDQFDLTRYSQPGQTAIVPYAGDAGGGGGGDSGSDEDVLDGLGSTLAFLATVAVLVHAWPLLLGRLAPLAVALDAGLAKVGGQAGNMLAMAAVMGAALLVHLVMAGLLLRTRCSVLRVLSVALLLVALTEALTAGLQVTGLLPSSCSGVASLVHGSCAASLWSWGTSLIAMVGLSSVLAPIAWASGIATALASLAAAVAAQAVLLVPVLMVRN